MPYPCEAKIKVKKINKQTKMEKQKNAESILSKTKRLEIEKEGLKTWANYLKWQLEVEKGESSRCLLDSEKQRKLTLLYISIVSYKAVLLYAFLLPTQQIIPILILIVLLFFIIPLWVDKIKGLDDVKELFVFGFIPLIIAFIITLFYGFLFYEI